MFVERLRVKGYRSLENIDISFRPGLNVLVGKNNAGKSNIITALDILLGERWPTYANFEERDFYRSRGTEPDEHLLIAVKLGGRDLPSVLKTCPDARAYYRQLDHQPRFDTLPCLGTEWRGQFAGSDYLSEWMEQMRHLYLVLEVPRQGEQDERVLSVCAMFKDGWYEFRRFNASFRDALLTTARVPSFRDPGQQLRIAQYTWYGKLIRSLYDQAGEEESRKIQQLQNSLTDSVGEIFRDVTSRLSERLGRAIFHQKVEFRPGAYTPDDAYKQITMFVDDGLDGPYYDKGSGIQSALIIALFAYYCEHFHRGASLLLAEEPELYLHPQARRAINAQLVDFASPRGADDSALRCGRQVIVSSHSVEFVRSVELNSVACIRKPAGNTATYVCQVDEIDDDTTRRWRQVIRTKNAEMLFADHVILVEGGEEYILSPIADLCFSERGWLDSHNISVVRADGKMQFQAYVDILNELNIAYTILTDLDIVRQGLTDKLCPMEGDARQRLIGIRARIHAESTSPRGRDIKDALSPSTRNWQTLYGEVDEALSSLECGQVPSDERLVAIRDLWSSLQDRVSKPNIRDCIGDDDIDWLCEIARGNEIHILARGELEDYWQDGANSLSEDSKDRRALIVGQALAECKDLVEAERWIDYEEFTALLKAVARRMGVSRDIIDEEVPF